MQQHHGKKIWIIGASSGIGAALAQTLAKAGATLILSARRQGKLEDVLGQLQGSGHKVVALDVSDADAFAHAAKAIGSVDSVIYLAAIYKPNATALSDVKQALDVNLFGAFACVDAVRDIFKQQGHGQILLCASVAGYRGLPNAQPYCATKAALINYAESLKIELEPEHIDVKIICPGFVKTDLTDKNDFKMPMMISADEAASAISKGLTQKGFEIHFPKRFTFIMKSLRLMPNWLFFTFSRKMRR